MRVVFMQLSPDMSSFQAAGPIDVCAVFIQRGADSPVRMFLASSLPLLTEL